jgi:hypothetical protein
MPSGAVASLLAKEGKKKTIFFFISAFRSEGILRFLTLPVVTAMSTNCQLWFEGRLRTAIPR